jgi:sulfur carrier protein ThiS
MRTARVYVNGVAVEVPESSTVLEAVEKAGYSVPVLCYLEGLFNEATCRICVVSVNGRVVPACRFPVSDGAKIATESDELTRYRRTNLELILSTHKIKCWDCSRKTSCELLKLSKQLGVEGIPVCAECPLAGDSCLVVRGEPCLGPLTVAGCSAECTRNGTPCTGCRGFISKPEVWKAAADFYREHRVDPRKIETAMKLFWSSVPSHLKNVLLGDKP